MLKLGAGYPEELLGKDPQALAHYFAALEELGYHHVGAGDHVLGAETAVRPDWRPYFGKAAYHDKSSIFHEPMVLFGYLAGLTKKLVFSNSILIMPQRQTLLLAKQAAEIDVLTGGRLRLVPAIGWNDVEYRGMQADFSVRGPMFVEQVELLRRLWTEEIVTFKGRFHNVDRVGLNPMPVQRPILMWYGGASAPVLRRTGRTGDGWYPWYPYFNEAKIRRDWETIKQSAREAGRDPATIGFQGAVYFLDGRFTPEPGDDTTLPKSLDEMVAYAKRFERMGATHFGVGTSWLPRGAGIDARLEGYRQFKAALERA